MQKTLLVVLALNIIIYLSALVVFSMEIMVKDHLTFRSASSLIIFELPSFVITICFIIGTFSRRSRTIAKKTAILTIGCIFMIPTNLFNAMIWHGGFL